jgi:hypothetical protein
VVVNGAPKGGIVRKSVDEGDRVVIVVISNVADECISTATTSLVTSPRAALSGLPSTPRFIALAVVAVLLAAWLGERRARVAQRRREDVLVGATKPA